MANLLPKKWVVLWAVMVLCPLSTAQQTIYYLPFDETFSEQIILQEARTTAYEGEKLLSPNQLGFVQLLQPTFSEKAPWSTTLFIQHTNGKTLHLDLLNHANIHPRTTWINDELLYIKVWWGRVLGTELILDLKNSTFIYKRMFAYDLYSFSQKANSSQRFRQVNSKWINCSCDRVNRLSQKTQVSKADYLPCDLSLSPLYLVI